jgi:dihydropteroate synthase
MDQDLSFATLRMLAKISGTNNNNVCWTVLLMTSSRILYTLLSVKQRSTSWQCRTRVVSLESPTLVGILNVTPDSFSDGGKFVDVRQATEHALALEEAGAAIIDIGGESTRPGASRISAEDQIARTEPVIRSIREQSKVCISIDTTLAEVARVALTAGADIINDVSAGTEDVSMFSLAAETGAGLVLMHRRLPPELDQYCDQYESSPESDDIVKDVLDWLEIRISAAMATGVSESAIAIDPGLGFGKSVEQNWQLVHEINRITELGYPVYVGASRKSFIGANVGLDIPKLRDEASVEVAKKMADSGAQIFRVHNVSGHVRVLQSHLAQPEP